MVKPRRVLTLFLADLYIIILGLFFVTIEKGRQLTNFVSAKSGQDCQAVVGALRW